MALLSGRRWWRALWVALLLAACPVSFAAQPAAEYAVKAVFLFNFAQFVEWPADAFQAVDAPFVIGILGPDPFGSELDDVVRGESINGRRFVVRRFNDLAAVTACNILFIGQTDPQQVSGVVTALKGRSILTVSDGAADTPTGAVITLVTRNHRIRLLIDLNAASAAHLQMSSKLLQSATIIGGIEP